MGSAARQVRFPFCHAARRRAIHPHKAHAIALQCYVERFKLLCCALAYARIRAIVFRELAHASRGLAARLTAARAPPPRASSKLPVADAHSSAPRYWRDSVPRNGLVSWDLWRLRTVSAAAHARSWASLIPFVTHAPHDTAASRACRLRSAPEQRGACPWLHAPLHSTAAGPVCALATLRRRGRYRHTSARRLPDDHSSHDSGPARPDSFAGLCTHTGSNTCRAAPLPRRDAFGTLPGVTPAPILPSLIPPCPSPDSDAFVSLQRRTSARPTAARWARCAAATPASRTPRRGTSSATMRRAAARTRPSTPASTLWAL